MEFAKAGYEVYGSDMHRERRISSCLAYYPCDLEDFAAVEQLIEKLRPDIIVNLAAVSSVGLSWSIPQKTMSINVGGALNILEAARKHATEAKVLLIGSSEEYVPSQDPLDETCEISANNPYGISKVAMEQFSELYRRNYGMKVYNVRAFNHTGIGQRDSFVLPSWCRQAAAISASGTDGKIIVGNLKVRRDFSDVRDIVHAYRLVVESGNCGEIYNIGSGRAYALKDLLDCIISFSERNIETEVDKKLLRAADNPVIWCNNKKITNQLGWIPRYPIKETLRDMFDYYIRLYHG